MNTKGLFIVLEGVDGSGKSTQAAKLAEWLTRRTSRKTERTAEPYILRELILGRKDLCKTSELLLFLADRAQHVDKIINPTLEAGHNVICERFNDSTLAYQVGGHAINFSKVADLIKVCDFPEPDIKIFLDLSPEVALERVRARNNQNDRFEDEGLSLIKKVAAAYREIFSKSLPNLIKVECDNKNEEQVFNLITSNLNSVLKFEELF